MNPATYQPRTTAIAAVAIRVVLVLERELPAGYRALAAQLGVAVIEDVYPRNVQ